MQAVILIDLLDFILEKVLVDVPGEGAYKDTDPHPFCPFQSTALIGDVVSLFANTYDGKCRFDPLVTQSRYTLDQLCCHLIRNVLAEQNIGHAILLVNVLNRVFCPF